MHQPLPSSHRIKMTLSYNGAKFAGSQVQTSTPNTVMGTLERSLKQLGIGGKPIASGRTDAGVHAFRQVVHVDVPPHWYDHSKLIHTLQRHLPASIHVRHISLARSDFHARYSAKRRAYRYILSQRAPTPFEADFVTFAHNLDFEAIQRAMQCYTGEHDFDYFKKTGSDVTHYVRTIYRSFAYRHRKQVVLYFEANGFLRSQIRLMTAAVLRVNSKKMTLSQLKEQIDAKARYCTDLAPPNGLYLSNIIY